MRNRPFYVPCLVLVGLLFAGIAPEAASAATLVQKFDKTFPLTAGGQLELTNVNGGVTIEAWDRNEVHVVAEKKVKAGSDEKAREVMGQVQVVVTPRAGALKVETKLPKRPDGGFFDWLSGNDVNVNVNYKVQVPRAAKLDVDTVNGGLQVTGTRGEADLETTNGGITVAQVDGNLKLESTNGGIHVTDSAGAVHASTTNGGIEVALRDLPDDSDLSLSTTNGGVDIKLPRNARLSIDAATTNGKIASDFDVTGGTSSKRHLTGDINGGGGKLKVRTTNGSVGIEGQ